MVRGVFLHFWRIGASRRYGFSVNVVVENGEFDAQTYCVL
jgi:hypothetical protein